jgi:hypothetical protein
MATSTNYGWSEPDDSSLVRDGALAMRTLGNAIDTSLWNSGYGQAGKNKIVNGDFTINQRSFTSISAGTVTSYGFDRWLNSGSGGTITYTAQTFTLGAAPVAGYEARNYIDVQTTGQTLTNTSTRLDQRIESVRTFAGQTATFSFWAKAASGTPKIAVELDQQFGTGGSPSARVTTYAGQVTLSTLWARYSVTVAVPSISGKTIGTSGGDYLALDLWVSAGSDFNARTGSLGIQTNTFSIWGVQAEYGSKMTPFQTASGGSIQNELAMCQRYYWRWNAIDNYSPFGQGISTSTTNAQIFVQYPVTMRAKPAAGVDFSTLVISDIGSYNLAISAIVLSNATTQMAELGCTNAATATASRGAFIRSNNSANGYLGLSAEL